MTRNTATKYLNPNLYGGNLVMKSHFHIQCSTAEDLRNELLAWLTVRETSAQDEAEHVAKTKKSQLVSFTEARVYREVAAFWREIIIDNKASDERKPYTPGDGSPLDKLRMGGTS